MASISTTSTLTRSNFRTANFRLSASSCKAASTPVFRTCLEKSILRRLPCEYFFQRRRRDRFTTQLLVMAICSLIKKILTTLQLAVSLILFRPLEISTKNFIVLDSENRRLNLFSFCFSKELIIRKQITRI